MHPELYEPRLEAVLLCDSAGVTSDERAILWGVFNHVVIDPKRGTSGGVPCYLFIRTVATMEEPIEIRVYDPKGEVVDRVPGEDPARWVSEERPWPGYVELLWPLMLRVGEEGMYVLEILYRGLSLGRTHLIVEFRDLAAEQSEKLN